MGSIDTIRSGLRNAMPSHRLYLPVNGAGWLSRLWSWYCDYRAIQHSRAQLRTLSDAQLRDIGISWVEAEAEAAKGGLWV